MIDDLQHLASRSAAQALARLGQKRTFLDATPLIGERCRKFDLLLRDGRASFRVITMTPMGAPRADWDRETARKSASRWPSVKVIFRIGQRIRDMMPSLRATARRSPSSVRRDREWFGYSINWSGKTIGFCPKNTRLLAL